MFDLGGKVALVAGGAGYLGTPVCQKLSEQGARVIVADLNADRARAVAAQVGGRGEQLDIGSQDAISAVVQRAAAEFGRLDVLVNCTYSSIGSRVEELTEADFDRTNHVNLTGSFLLAREAAGTMAGGGSMIFFSSMYGQVAPDPRVYTGEMKPNPIEYGVGKAGLIQMVRYLAVHWGPRNIRVNAIAPGPFPNPDVQRDYPGFVQRLAERVPLGRIGRPEEMAGAVVFLASDEASYVTGETFGINGGWTAW